MSVVKNTEPGLRVVSEPRIPRQLRSIRMDEIQRIADSEGLTVTDQVRLMLSYATFKWRSGWRGDLGVDTHSIKLYSAGVDAVKTVADAEKLAWDAMAAQLMAFAVAEWIPGWRKDNPGDLGPAGISKHGPPKVKAGHFDHARFGELLKDQSKL